MFSPDEKAMLAKIRASMMNGIEPLIDHKLVADQTSTIAAAATGTAIAVRPYSNGVIVTCEGFAYASGGDAEADTMAEFMHEKYMAALVNIGGLPKTNGTYESLFTLCRDPRGGWRKVWWPVMQNDLIEVTFKNLATAGIASLKAQINFGFIPFKAL